MTFNQALIFGCGNEEYAVPVEQVVSIEKLNNITPIPHLPIYLLGFTKIRGEIIPIIDLNRILYNRESNGELCRIIVVNTDIVHFGLVVSEAKEIVDFSGTDIHQVGLVNYTKTQYFTAVANLENRMITCVNPKILVNSLEGIREIIDYLEKMRQDESALNT